MRVEEGKQEERGLSFLTMKSLFLKVSYIAAACVWLFSSTASSRVPTQADEPILERNRGNDEKLALDKRWESENLALIPRKSHLTEYNGVQLTDSHGGSGIHFVPIKKHRFTILWFHGLGNNAMDFAGLCVRLRELGGLFEDCKFVIPNAPFRVVSGRENSITTAWADIPCFSGYQEDTASWLATAERINHLIADEAQLIEKAEGIRNGSSRVLLGGFSQGGALAYLAFLLSPLVVGGAAVVAGWIPIHQEIMKKINPVLVGNPTATVLAHFHGKDDRIVQEKWGQMSVALVQNMRIPAKYKTYDGMRHALTSELLTDVTHFFQQRMTEILGSS